jgi:heptosyltransferase II
MGKKIFIVAPAWLGDLVMAQSLFKVLHERGHTLDVLAPQWNFAVLDRMPEVRKKIVMPIGHGELKIGLRRQIGHQLRAERYDQAIVLPNSFKSALIPWFASIPQRTGWAREGRALIMNDTRRLDKKAYPLMVQRFVALAYDNDHPWDHETCPPPALQVDENNVRAVMAELKLLIAPNQQVLALAPGAAFGETKRWPMEYYADIANKKLQQGWQVWLFGSPQEASLLQDIQARCDNRCIDCHHLGVDKKIDLMSLAHMVVTNDSGMLHVAAALQRSLVAIYGSTTPSFTPPLTNKAAILSVDISCRPCFKRECPYGHLKCLRDISPEQVSFSMQKLLHRENAV